TGALRWLLLGTCSDLSGSALAFASPCDAFAIAARSSKSFAERVPLVRRRRRASCCQAGRSCDQLKISDRTSLRASGDSSGATGDAMEGGGAEVGSGFADICGT